MTLKKEPMCPYCGSRMEVTAKSRLDEQKNEWWTGWCFCSSCGAEGPKAYGRLTADRAKEAAEVRATMIHARMVENALAGVEKQKPLTWDEAIADDYYLEQRGDEYVDVALNVLAASTDGPEPDPDDCICYTTHSEDYLKLMRTDYGKTWRCWARRPTEEERRAAKWITT